MVSPNNWNRDRSPRRRSGLRACDRPAPSRNSGAFRVCGPKARGALQHRASAKIVQSRGWVWHPWQGSGEGWQQQRAVAGVRELWRRIGMGREWPNAGAAICHPESLGQRCKRISRYPPETRLRAWAISRRTCRRSLEAFQVAPTRGRWLGKIRP